MEGNQQSGTPEKMPKIKRQGERRPAEKTPTRLEYGWWRPIVLPEGTPTEWAKNRTSHADKRSAKLAHRKHSKWKGAKAQVKVVKDGVHKKQSLPK